MNKNFLILLLIFISTGFKPVYKNYCNARFNFCVPYPADFTKLPESENRDGRIFISKDKKAEIRMYGSLAIEEFDMLTQQYDTQISETRVTYKKFGSNCFIFSGVETNGNFVYLKTVKKKINYMGSPDTFVFQTLRISYPASQGKKYEAYCAMIAKSL